MADETEDGKGVDNQNLKGYEIVTRENCPWCFRAKKEMNRKGIPFKETKVDVDASVEEVKKRFPGVKMLPIVVFDGQVIGGYENLVDHLGAMEKENENGKG